MKLDGTPEEARAQYIIRDHEEGKFNERKALMQEIADKMNAELGQNRVKPVIKDQYYNMAQIIEKICQLLILPKSNGKS